MALYGAFDVTKHFSELGEPLDTQEGTLTPAQRRARALVNLGLGAEDAELELLDGALAGTVVNSKAAIYSSAGRLARSSAVVAGAGTIQGDATAMTAELNVVTGADGTVGVKLPTSAADNVVIVINSSASAVMKVYPALGAQVNALGANAAFSLGPDRMAVFIGRSTTLWYAAGYSAATPTVTELATLAGVTAGTVTAGKAVVTTTGKTVDELNITLLKVGTVDKSNVLIGAASGYKLARSASPVSLDGSNPTSVAHGLTTCLSAQVQLVGSAAPGDSTSVLTCVINGANIDVYAWKHTTGGAAGNPTLVASTGTETFNWVAIGT